MRVKRWTPFDDLAEVQRDLSRFFRGAVGFGSERLGLMEKDRWMPAIDMYSKDGALIIKAELPGVNSADIDVSVKGDLLIISGERKTESEINEKNVYRLETSYGKFQRSISLPKEVKAESVKATYKDGILSVKVPEVAAKETKEEKVDIEVASN